MESLIKAENLTRYYGPHRAVDNLSFSLKKGDVLGFLGPNGAGKSSTMQMITGNLAPTSGRVLVNGYDMHKQPKQARQSLGYLPSPPPLYPDMTVREYLHYCARLHQVPARACSTAMERAMDQCSLGTVNKRLIGNLSRGYQQRVGIAQALLHNPAAIILDEPTAGLDPLQVNEILELIRSLSAEHGILLSTHVLSEVTQCCNKIRIIHRGRTVLEDSMTTLQSRMQLSSLRIRIRQPLPDMSSLRALPGVTSVSTINGLNLLVQHDPAADPAEAISGYIVSSGCGLLEITPEARSLEELFLNLTLEPAGSSLP